MAKDPPERLLHHGLPVHGYIPQDGWAVDIVNEGKLIEEVVMRYLDGLERLAYTDPADREIAEGLVARDRRLTTGRVDPRFIAMGRSEIQKGFMLAFRGVFQPGRPALPSEFDFDHLTFK